jgi:hypothetical protein
MTDTQTHGHQTESGQSIGGGRREWAVLIPKLLAIARSFDKQVIHFLYNQRSIYVHKTIFSNFLPCNKKLMLCIQPLGA